MESLPGGLWQEGQRHRGFRFHPVDGALELALSDLVASTASTPAVVTAALSLALAELAGGEPTPERVRQLCVADRQFLMRWLGMHLGERESWLNAACHRCGESFDFYLDYRSLPVAEADDHFPEVAVALERGTWRFRLPNGDDQEALSQSGEWDPLALLERCLLEPGPISHLVPAECEAIDRALEEATPGVVTEVQARCPHCGRDNQVALNPYGFIGRPPDHLLTEVHQLAVHYHWSEREILALPRARRSAYLRLIDRARGMVQ